MPKVKGRKQRKLRKDRINFLMRLCPRQHQQLKRLAEHRQETIALIIECYLEYMLLGEIAKLDRQQEQERMVVAVVPNFEAELYQEAYSEVESLVGSAWLRMGEKSFGFYSHVSLRGRSQISSDDGYDQARLSED